MSFRDIAFLFMCLLMMGTGIISILADKERQSRLHVCVPDEQASFDYTESNGFTEVNSLREGYHCFYKLPDDEKTGR